MVGDNRADVFEMMRREMEQMIDSGDRPTLSWAINTETGAMGAVRSCFENTDEVRTAIKTNVQIWGHKFLFDALGLSHEQALKMSFVFGHIFWTIDKPVDLQDGRHIHLDFDPTRGRIQLPHDFIRAAGLIIDYLSPNSFIHIPCGYYPGKGSTETLKKLHTLAELASCTL